MQNLRWAYLIRSEIQENYKWKELDENEWIVHPLPIKAKVLC